MRARIGLVLGQHWGGIVYAIDVIALIGALGAIGGLPVLLNALTRYTRFAMRWLRGPSGESTVNPHGASSNGHRLRYEQ